MFGRRGTWLSDTGQVWKVYVLLLLVAVGGVGVVGVVWSSQAPVTSDPESLSPLAFALAGLAGGLGAFAWLAFAIRCPACGAKVAWRAVRTAPAGRWLMELLSMKACPACGRQSSVR